MRKMEIKTGYGKPEQASIYLPLPPGPYIMLRQDDPRIKKWLGTDFGKACLEANSDEIKANFDIQWGMVTIGSLGGLADIFGYHYDTSG